MAKRKKQTGENRSIAEIGNEAPPVQKKFSASRFALELLRFLFSPFAWLYNFIARYLMKIPHSLNITRGDKIQMFEKIDSDSNYRSYPYWIFIISSCGIATFGLVTNSPAVIIGAMLVSPLMSPITGIGLSIAINDLYLGIKSILTIVFSITIAVLTSALITSALPLGEPTAEILGRTNPTALDLFIALFCGIVAGFSSVRSRGEVVLASVAPGAAIGVALMPPLCVVGYGLGSGVNWTMMWGGFLLFLTNLFAIILTTSLFYSVVYRKINNAQLILDATASREVNEPIYHKVVNHPLFLQLNSIKPTRKRFLYPAALILLVSYPLTSSFLYLKEKEELRQFINGRFSTKEGVTLLKGPERLLYTRDAVTGSIIFSAGQINSVEFEKELNTTIAKKFPKFKPSISLIRVAGESDLKAISLTQPQKLAFEDDPNMLYDAVKDRHASDLVKRAFDLVHLRFPEEAGTFIGVRILFDTHGMNTILIDYAGKRLSDESRSILSSTLQNDLSALKGSPVEISIERLSAEQNYYGCRRSFPETKVLERLATLIERLKMNEFLALDVAFSASFKEKIPAMIQTAGVEKRIRYVKQKKGCRLEYEYHNGFRSQNL